MILRVLGCSGSNLPGCFLPSFLINGHILLDAGSATDVLNLDEQAALTNIFISHSHLDHIKDLPFLADNLISSLPDRAKPPVTIMALPEIIQNMAQHVLNDTIWPDFTAIPQNFPVLAYSSFEEGHEKVLPDVTVSVFRVDHAGCASGFILKGPRKEEIMAYTGDTGPDTSWCDYLNTLDLNIHHLIVEASFPNALEKLAVASKHLTPRLLRKTLNQLNFKPKVYVSHLKFNYIETILAELAEELAEYDYLPLKEGDIFHF